MLDLVLAYRYRVRAIEQDVCRLEHRVVEDAGVHALLPLGLLLELHLTFALAPWRDGVEDPRQLGMFRPVGLHEQAAAHGIDARREQPRRHLTATRAQRRRL